MKYSFCTTVLLLVFFQLNLKSQTVQENKTKLHSSSTKSEFINQGAYLNKSSLKDFSGFFADSLKGFDEVTTKNDLLGLGLSGEEYLGYLTQLKRRFINQKYQLNKTVSAGGNTNASGGKIIGGQNNTQVIPCVNEDLEMTIPGVYTTSNAVIGWTVSSRTSDGTCTPTNWIAGSGEFSIVATPILSFPTIGTVPSSPLGGLVVARLNDFTASFQQTKLSQTFPVTTANCVFQYAYAGVWQDGGAGHTCCTEAAFDLVVRDCFGNIIPCLTPTLNPANTSCTTGILSYSYTGGNFWTSWQVRAIDLSSYIGTCVTIEAIGSDCAYGGHAGTSLFDARCAGLNTCVFCPNGIPGMNGNVTAVNFCTGSTQAVIQAPPGYATYSWTAPPSYSAQLAANQFSLSAITITNAIPGNVFNVNVTTSTGCSSNFSYTLAYTQVSVGIFNSSPACPLGSNGTATIYPNGSGNGYNYSWINSTNSVISTGSVASNLAPGSYSVQLSAGVGCGSAVATVTVGSIQPTLSVVSSSIACEGKTNGSIVLSYDPGYPSSTLKTLNVLNVTPSPAFAYSLASTLNTFTISNLYGPGSYSAILLDGNCSSSINFNINAYMTSSLFSLSPQSSSLCQGQSTIAGVVTTGSITGNMMTYTWTPNIFLFGNNPNLQSTLITPSAAPGTINTTIYTLTVTEPVMNCSFGKTLTVSSVYPATPSFSSIPALCSNSGTFQVIANPSGGSFGSNLSINQSGIITPSLANMGTNQFSYSYYVAGCPATGLANFTLSPPLVVTISGNTSICLGQSTTLLANGSSNFSWNTGSTSQLLSLSPVNTSTYSVTGMNSALTCSAMATVTIMVYPNPTLSLIGDTLICEGETASIMASGANLYSWNNGNTGSAMVVSPLVSTVFTVTGTINPGSCSATKTIALSVSPCTGISNTLLESGLRLYPNPTKGLLYLETDKELLISLSDAVGKCLIEKHLLKTNETLNMSQLPSGMYILSIQEKDHFSSIKLIKTD